MQICYCKPAYDGVRAAMDDYFGPAFVVKDSSGKELMRFVENGNVLLMGEGTGSRVNQSFTDWQSLGLPSTSSAAFIVQQLDGNGDPAYKAVLTAGGNLYLSGVVHDPAPDLAQPTSGAAFVVKSKDGTVQSLIDDGGNLSFRGCFLVNGVPYALEQEHGGPNGDDPYSTYQ